MESELTQRKTLPCAECRLAEFRDKATPCSGCGAILIASEGMSELKSLPARKVYKLYVNGYELAFDPNDRVSWPEKDRLWPKSR